MLDLHLDGSEIRPDMPSPPPYLDFFDCLIKLERNEALAMVDNYLADGGEPLDLYAELLEPTLCHSGREWQAGRISVAHEHYISEVTRDVLLRCGATIGATPAAGAPVVVACCVARERHTIGLMMVCDALREAGAVVHLLGETLPAEALLGLIAQVDAVLLCLSCTLDVHLPAATDLIRLVRRERPGVRVVVGGAALRDRGEPLRQRLGADFTASDARAVRRLLPDWLREMATTATTAPSAPET